MKDMWTDVFRRFGIVMDFGMIFVEHEDTLWCFLNVDFDVPLCA